MLWLGLPVRVLGGPALARTVLAAGRRRRRAARGLLAAVAARAAIGYGFDVLAAPAALRDCGSP
ncbi:hypothetical protein H4F94_00070, partial [Streptomyces sp. SP18CM02]|nr:hypothetical protein [Streptomyces sp. SP18CM02]